MLLKFARLCGIGPSRRVLMRHTGKLMRLGTLHFPDRLVLAVAQRMLAEPSCRFRRLHIYPFGGLERTARWLEAVAGGAITLNAEASDASAPLDI